MTKLLLLDFDGVLVESLDVYEQTVTECLKAMGMPIVKEREDFLKLFDINFYEALTQRGVNLEQFARNAEPILKTVHVRRIVPFLPVCSAFASFPASISIAIISSNSAETITAVFNSWEIAPFYKEIWGSEFRYSKQEKIALAIKTFNAKPADAIYVGDTVGDIIEANMAGVKAMAVTWGWHSHNRLKQANPDFLVDTPEELSANLLVS